MTAQILDGKRLSEALRATITQQVAALTASGARPPCLKVILVGDHAASAVYVANKEKQARACGFDAETIRLDKDVSQESLLAIITELNQNRSVDGILVQLPLPDHINPASVTEAITPHKDVDGFGMYHQGALWAGEPGMIPCTPQGCMLLLKSALPDVRGLHAVVIGRSAIVGKPMAALLLREHATVTLCHSQTRNLPDVVRQADIVVAAIGKPEYVQGDWIKSGAVVIDVGINRLENGRLVGDVAFDDACARAAFISPVPGGVGPMTIACLLQNTLLGYGKGQSV